MQWCLSCAQRWIYDLAFCFLCNYHWHSSLCIRAPATSHCVLTGGDVTRTSCWELRGGLSWQEFHRNGHWQKEDVRHHVIDSWWCRNLCYPIKAHKPHHGSAFHWKLPLSCSSCILQGWGLFGLLTCFLLSALVLVLHKNEVVKTFANQKC